MANVTPGYVFLGINDPITFTKLNMLGTPTVSIGSQEVTVAMLAPLTSAGRLIGSSPTTTTAAELLINSSGATLHSGVGLTFGDNDGDSGIAIGQASDAKLKITWTYSATKSTAQSSIYSNFGDANNVGFAFSASSILSQMAGNASWSWQSDGTLINLGGAAINTTAVAGFVHIASCAGTPTGVPTNSGGGKVPMVYDSSANKIWFYNGSWRGVVVS